MKNVCIIGAGNIGSRHLQALKKVSSLLNIIVIDQSSESLKTAGERYNQVESKLKHQIVFASDMESLPKKIDLAIIATGSKVRRKVLENLLSNTAVKYLILEKILFSKFTDYEEMGKLLNKKVDKTWVNFSMRTQSFYFNLKEKIKGNVQMFVSGSDYGLVTNSIHFIDYIAYLTDCDEFVVDMTGVKPKPIKSKREGYLELSGTLNFNFKNGSFGSFTYYPEGSSPYLIQIMSQDLRCISKESEGKAYVSREKDNWKWEEVETKIPYQSEMTNKVVEQILKTGDCPLADYKNAAKLHLQLLESLQKFLNKNSKIKYKSYPFT